MEQKYEKVYFDMDKMEFVYPTLFHGEYAVEEFLHNARQKCKRMFRVEKRTVNTLKKIGAENTFIKQHFGYDLTEFDYKDYEWYSVELLAQCKKKSEKNRPSITDIEINHSLDFTEEDTEALKWFVYKVCNVPEDEVNYFHTAEELIEKKENNHYEKSRIFIC